ncbi:MAG: hypothetical protein J7K66_04380 [Anaerolineaceae bacterium]|nr:hypothetical protein [Anaerolineaceae bacterium]
MKEGLLWYDGRENIDIKERVASAVKFFELKYGYVPNKCFVNPIILEKPFELDREIKVLPNDRVIVNHIWLEFISE